MAPTESTTNRGGKCDRCSELCPSVNASRSKTSTNRRTLHQIQETVQSKAAAESRSENDKTQTQTQPLQRRLQNQQRRLRKRPSKADICVRAATKQSDTAQTQNSSRIVQNRKHNNGRNVTVENGRNTTNMTQYTDIHTFYLKWCGVQDLCLVLAITRLLSEPALSLNMAVESSACTCAAASRRSRVRAIVFLGNTRL